MTSTQFTALQTELAKSAYASAITAGNTAAILALLNAQTIPGDHYISSADLWNALASSGALAIIIAGQTNANAAIAAGCVMALETLRHSGIQQYHLENSEMQSLMSGFVAAGMMTQAQVTQLESAFTQQFTSVADGILGRDATLQDLWDYQAAEGTL